MNPYTQQKRVINATKSILSDTTPTIQNTVPPRNNPLTASYIKDVDAMNKADYDDDDDDDDAMIEAYCMENDDNEHPPDNSYNTFFDEEFENVVPTAASQTQTKHLSNTGTATNAATIATSTLDSFSRSHHSHAISSTFREEDNTDIDDDDMDVTTTVKRNDKYKVRRPKQDLYKFERYVDHSQWRAEKMPSPMRAKRWKTTTMKGTTNISSSHVKTSSTAPDSMLLNFLNQRHYGSTVIKKKVPHSIRYCSIPKYPTLGKTCIPMTLGDDTRVHIPLKNSGSIINESRSPANAAVSDTTTVGDSNIETLLRRVRVNRRRREHEKSVQGSTLEKANVDATVVDNENSNESSVSFESPTVIDPNHFNSSSSQLWVDKHAPKSFAHLLSDERCNRDVVRALRQWDPYVFHREPPKRVVDRRHHVEENHKTNKAESKSKDTRPDESSRVILLSGPPGVGKTTLAHIVARHVGYRPIEVNGSDERTESALTDRVIRAMESSTLQFQPATTSSDSKKDNMYNRPNCLILDEIDGADAAKAVQALVEIIRAEVPSSSAKKKHQYLRRPIIFVCNNKYVPALKPLLPFAKQFDIYPPSTTRLIARLRSILTAEDLSLSAGGNSLLNQLVISSSGDIRSCLYTLQFASTRAYNKECNTRAHTSTAFDDGNETTDIHTIDISNALRSVLTGEGLKDVRTDIVGTMTCIFQKVKKSDTFGKNAVPFRSDGATSSIDKILDAVRSFGDNSRLLDCLYMNILRVSYIDPSFDRCSAALEWMSSTDIYRSGKQLSTADGHYLDALHTPAVAAAAHILCQIEQPQDLTYSIRDLTDSIYHMESNKALIQKFLDGLCIRAKATRTALFQVSAETIPFALWILSSGEGSSSLQRSVTSIDLLSKTEFEMFEHHVAILRALGLKYVGVVPGMEHIARSSPKSFGTAKIALDPPIENLVKFVDIPNERLDIPPALKQLLSRKAVLERSTGSVVNEKPQAPKIQRKAEPSKMAASNNFLLLGAKKAKALRSERCAARVACMDMNNRGSTNKLFGRSTNADRNRLSNTGSGVPLSEVVRLKYVKGFTQAVSMPCRLDDL